jgi:hypothetical protein
MTAVEWLYENLKSHFEHDGDLLEAVKMSFEHAKEMQKEQKIQFANEYSHAVMGGCLLTPTEFYNETFKSE